jgi:putative peptidoglycan lipid II flippase
MTALLVISAWALGILNSHRRFFVSYVAPVAWNAGIITALVVFGSFLGWEAAGRDADLVTAMAWGALAGGALQLIAQLPWAVPVLKHFRLSLSRRVQGVKEAIRNFLPVVAARGIVNISGFLEIVLAGLLVQGAVAMLRSSQTLYFLPIALFGMSIAAAELPELSRRREDVQGILVPRVRLALDRVAFFLIPSALAYLTFGDVLIAGLLQRGDFGPTDTAAVHMVLAAYALGLPASASSRSLSSAFYALRDTRTPAIIATGRVVLSLAIGASLMFPLDRIGVGELRFGAAGLAFGSAVGAWMEYGLLRKRLAGHLGPHGPKWGRLGRMAVAGLVAMGVGLGTKRILGFSGSAGLLPEVMETGSLLLDPLAAVGTAGAFGVAYLVLSALLGVGIPLRAGRPRTS